MKTTHDTAATEGCAPVTGYARGAEIYKLMKRMNEEEAREKIGMNLRHTEEITASIAAAVNAERWHEAQECIILLNMKVALLNADLASMARHSA